MKRANLIDIFDASSRKLEAGVPLEEVLAEHPDQREELRELLLAARMAQHPAARRVPASAQIDSRRRFLAKADLMIEQSQKQTGIVGRLGFFLQEHLTSGAVILVFALLLFVALRSTGTLPNAPLTPQTGAVQTETAPPASGASRQFDAAILQDQQEAEAVRQRIAANQSGEVQFAGFLRNEGNNQWTVASIPIQISSALTSQFAGQYIQVNGQLEDGVVLAQQIQSRIIDLEGILESIEDDRWVVDGLPVQINSSTAISGTPKLGEQVAVQVMPVEGQAEPVSLSISGSGAVPPVPSSTQPTNTPNTELTLRPSATPQPGPTNSQRVTITPRTISKPTEIETEEHEDDREDKAREHRDEKKDENKDDDD